jgi:hypothetical protein
MDQPVYTCTATHISIFIYFFVSSNFLLRLFYWLQIFSTLSMKIYVIPFITTETLIQS